MKTTFVATAIVLASAVYALAGPSSFQNTCSDISFFYDGKAAALGATCLTANGSPNQTSLQIPGIGNQDGKLVQGAGASTFQQSCGNIKIDVTPDAAVITAFCRKINGQSIPAKIELQNISNQNGKLSM